jgi:hypothetical protein
MADTKISAFSTKATPVTADLVPILDSASGNANAKATLGTIPAGTAATLATARAINGVNFDGSAAITIREVPVTTLPTTGNYIADSPCLGALLCAATTVPIYNLVYVDGSGTISLAKADAAATCTGYIGMATAQATSGNAVNILKSGLITYSEWSFTPGALLYISDATAGLLTATAPTTSGHFVKVVGIAVSATCVQLMMGHPTITLP